MSSDNNKTLDAMFGVKEITIKLNKQKKGTSYKYPKITGELIQTIALSPKRHISTIIAINDKNE